MASKSVAHSNRVRVQLHGGAFATGHVVGRYDTFDLVEVGGHVLLAPHVPQFGYPRICAAGARSERPTVR
ncbi:hypothetical protein H7I77_10025 [Mycolicibacterium novocastrense]|uniref:EAL-associated signaling domain protein n=1 Tax=Mycolicibacterium novocastrense TaxID=59813 RepID=A0AAW5SKY2_MYCNV|nr:MULTISPECIES: hypothetical protein [Mycolicibacterium]MCV7023683.1 hypothetical protein [Mycolicibacterium novocastrense]MDX1886920.1 hypothetical protein [Mycolicibacterium sp. 120270]GAT07670.1 EAL-associated signaling domain protein [Mycolicibacterium novocastrense]